MKHCILLLAGWLLGCCPCWAQSASPSLAAQITTLVPPSPNASSLGRFTEQPVALYTGLPTISLPFWTVKQGDLSLEVGLQYHGGGIKVDEIASCVGLGWTLQGPGLITRSVRGLPDLSVHFDYTYVNRYLANQMSAAQQLDYFQNVYEAKTEDSEPDWYTFSVGGLSGSFFAGPNNTIIVVPRELNVRVEQGAYDARSGKQYAWVLTDARGVRYKFADTEGSSSTNSDGLYDATTAWGVNELEDTQGNRVQLTYATDGSSYATVEQSYQVAGTTGCDAKFTGSSSTNASSMLRVTSITCGPEKLVFTADTQARRDIEGQAYGINAVEVWYGTSLKKRFRLYKSYWGEGAQPVPTGIQKMSDFYRLRLDSVREESATGTLYQPAYRFTYDNSGGAARQSYSQDHWGYYNAQPNSSLLTYVDQGGQVKGANRDPQPAVSLGLTLTAIRYPTGGRVQYEYEPNTTTVPAVEYVSLASLVGDNTPPASNAAETNFTYETTFTVTAAQSLYDTRVAITQVLNGSTALPPNHDGYQFDLGIYDAVTNQAVIQNLLPYTTLSLGPGHYRLRATLTTDFPGNPSFYFQAVLTGRRVVVKEVVGPGWRLKRLTKLTPGLASETQRYEYMLPDSTGRSSGAVLNWPSYLGSYTQVTSDAGYTSGCTYTTYSAHSSYPLLSCRSACTVYGFVTEYRENNGVPAGKTCYTYTLAEDYNAAPSFPFPALSSQDYKRGLPLAEQVYASRGTAYVLQRDTRWTYDTLATSSRRVMGLKMGRNGTVLRDGGRDIAGEAPYRFIASYALHSDSYQLTAKTVTNWEGGAAQRRTTTYTYWPDSYLLATSADSLSDGALTTTRLFYPGTYRQNAGSSPLLRTLLACNRLGVPVEQTQEVQRGAMTRLTGAVLHQYVAPGSAATGWQAYVQKRYVLNSSRAALADRYDFLHVPAHYDEQEYVRSANARALPQTIVHKQHQLVGYQWGYDNRLLQAQCANAASGEFFFVGFEEEASAQTGAAHTGTRFRTAYTVPWQPPTGRAYTLRYWYRQGGIWRQRKQAYSGPGVALTGGDAYDDVSVYPQDAQLTTYTYEPLVGTTSQTGPDGRTLFYEYDGLGRLVRTRDEQGRILGQQQYHYAGH